MLDLLYDPLTDTLSHFAAFQKHLLIENSSSFQYYNYMKESICLPSYFNDAELKCDNGLALKWGTLHLFALFSHAIYTKLGHFYHKDNLSLHSLIHQLKIKLS